MKYVVFRPMTECHIVVMVDVLLILMSADIVVWQRDWVPASSCNHSFTFFSLQIQDKVANVWCSLSVIIKLKSVAPGKMAVLR